MCAPQINPLPSVIDAICRMSTSGSWRHTSWASDIWSSTTTGAPCRGTTTLSSKSATRQGASPCDLRISRPRYFPLKFWIGSVLFFSWTFSSLFLWEFYLFSWSSLLRSKFWCVTNSTWPTSSLALRLTVPFAPWKASCSCLLFVLCGCGMVVAWLEADTLFPPKCGQYVFVRNQFCKPSQKSQTFMVAKILPRVILLLAEILFPLFFWSLGPPFSGSSFFFCTIGSIIQRASPIVVICHIWFPIASTPVSPDKWASRPALAEKWGNTMTRASREFKFERSDSPKDPQISPWLIPWSK